MSGSASEKRKWRSSLYVSLPFEAWIAEDQVLVAISVDDCGETEKQTFMLHRGLLCSHSPYFHNAFKGNFRESEDKTIHLPDVTASTMRIFQPWLYGQVPRSVSESRSKRPKQKPSVSALPWDEDEVLAPTVEDAIELATECLSHYLPWVDTDEFKFKEKHHFVQHMARLYAFGEIYNTPQLRRDVMTVLIQLANANPKKVAQRDYLKTAKELYDTVPSSSPICQYVIQRMSVECQLKSEFRWLLELLSDSEALIDLTIAVGCLRGDRDGVLKIKAMVLNACHFHEHTTVADVRSCRKSQRLDGAFFASLARVCMSEVYAAEDDKRTKKYTSIDEQTSFIESAKAPPV